MNKHAARTIAGFLISPAVPALMMYLLALISSSKHWEVLWLTNIVLIPGYIAALLFGIPAYLILKKKGKKELLHFSAAGAFVGFMTYALFFWPAVIEGIFYGKAHAVGVLRNTAGYSIVGTVSGLIAGIVFWFIAIRSIGNTGLSSPPVSR